jgi:hypothetical protein
MEKLPGVVPALGLTVSQLPPLLLEGVAANVSVDEAVMEIKSVCGTVAPVAKLNVTLLGDAVNVETPDELTFRITGTVLETPPATMETNPP